MIPSWLLIGASLPLALGQVIGSAGSSWCRAVAENAIERGVLFQDYWTFDQGFEEGFRAIAELGCYVEAARLIDAYVELSEDAIDSRGTEPWQKRLLRWHAGQMYAFAGDYDTARCRFQETFEAQAGILDLEASGEVDQARDARIWNAYVNATVAFLERDFEELIRCREDTVALSSQEDLQDNLAVIDAFIELFGRSYAEAYQASNER